MQEFLINGEGKLPAAAQLQELLEEGEGALRGERNPGSHSHPETLHREPWALG